MNLFIGASDYVYYLLSIRKDITYRLATKITIEKAEIPAADIK